MTTHEIQYDQAIADLVHRWFRPPAGVSAPQLARGMRRLLLLQAIAAGFFYLLV